MKMLASTISVTRELLAKEFRALPDDAEAYFPHKQKIAKAVQQMAKKRYKKLLKRLRRAKAHPHPHPYMPLPEELEHERGYLEYTTTARSEL